MTQYATIEFPSAGEIDDMSEEKEENIFGKTAATGLSNYDNDSKAEEYIIGDRDENPLRDAPDEPNDAEALPGAREQVEAADKE
jgi:hypothetical protein